MGAATKERTWQIEARVDKFHAEDEVIVKRTTRHGLLRRKRVECFATIRDGAVPYETISVDGNLLLNAGITRLENLLIGGGGQAYDATHTRVGVGDTSTAASASQTDLQAAATSANRQWKYVGSAGCTAPSVSGQTVTIIVTFATTEANFHWQEWGIDPGTADGTGASTSPMLNRKATDLGTKTSAASWQFTVTLTIS